MTNESETPCHHRSFSIKHNQMANDGEQHIYVECDVCGQKKSALVDWSRDVAYCGPVGEGEWATEVKQVDDDG